MGSAAPRVRVDNLRSLVFWATGTYLAIRFLDAIAITVLFFLLALVLSMAIDGPICWLQERGLSQNEGGRPQITSTGGCSPRFKHGRAPHSG